MRYKQNHFSFMRTGPLAVVFLVFAALSAWAAPNATTKIVFVQGNANKSLGAYKTFLETQVYPGQTIVYDGDKTTDAGAFNTTKNNGVFTPAQLARLNDADLIIVTSDISVIDYQALNWNPSNGPIDWPCLNVPIMLHHPALAVSSNLNLGNMDFSVSALNGDVINGWGAVGMWGMATINYRNNISLPAAANGVPIGSLCVGTSTWNTSLFSTDPLYSGVTVYTSSSDSSKWVQICGSAYATAGLGDSNGVAGNNAMTGGGLSLGSQTLSSPYYSCIARWDQGDAYYRAFRKSGSRRMFFALGRADNTDSANTFLNDPTNGATADGKRVLRNALTWLYDPANGRRPAPNAGADTKIYLPASQEVTYTLTDDSYSDGEGGSTGTLQWTLQAQDSQFEGTETIVSGATALHPTFRFTKPGVYFAQLKAQKPSHPNFVISQKTITVANVAAPYIASVKPSEGRMIVSNLTAPVTVTFDHAVTFTGAALQLAVTVGANSPVSVSGTTTDNVTFSFDCSAIDLTGQAANTPVRCSLDTSTVKDAIDGQLAFQGPRPYQWGYIYNTAGPKKIVICSSRSAALNDKYRTVLTNLYGTDTAPYITFLTSGYSTSPWSAATSATLQNASLVIIDSSDGQWSSLRSAQWNFLRAPLLTNDPFFCSDTTANANTAINMAPVAANNLTTAHRAVWAENYVDNPYYEGVDVRGDGMLHVCASVADVPNSGASVSSGEVPTRSLDYNGVTLNGTSLCYYKPDMSGAAANDQRKMVVYWPANTVYHSGTTNKAIGRRMAVPFYGNKSSSESNFGNMWASGLFSAPEANKLCENLHKYFAQPTGAPTVIWKDMDQSVRHTLTSVTVRFDRSVTAPGSLTIRDAAGSALGTYGPATTDNDGMSYTYAIDNSLMNGKGAQMLTFAIDMTPSGGVHETESGYNLPFLGGNDYIWQSYYDPANLRVKIGVASAFRVDADMKAFDFLLRSVYGRNAQINYLREDLSGATNDPNSIRRAPWSAKFLSTLQAQDMLIVSTDETKRNGTTYDVLSATTWAAAAPNDVASWPKPIISGTAIMYGNGSAADANWSNKSTGGEVYDGTNRTQIQAVDFDHSSDPLFNGVTWSSIVSGTSLQQVVNVYSAPYQGLFCAPFYYIPLSGNSNSLANPIGATQNNATKVMMAYAPPNTSFVTGATPTHAGWRAFNSLFHVAAVQYLTNEGRTIVRNQMRTVLPAPGVPTVVAVSPVANTLQANATLSVAVTFDRPVNGVGALTINGVTIAATAVGSAVNTVWTYAIPADQTLNVAAAVTASVDLSSTYETGSGMNLPCPNSSYTWSYTFDPAKWQGKVVIVSSNAALADDHSAYISFLQNTVYSTSLYPNGGVAIEDVPGKYYTSAAALTPAQLAALNTADVIAVLPFSSVSSLSPNSQVSKQWNTLAKPLILHNADLTANTGYGWGWSPNDKTNRVPSLAAPDTGAYPPGVSGSPLADPIMQGVSVIDDKIQYWNSDVSLMGTNDQVGIYNAHGAGLGGVGLVGDGYQSFLVHWPKYSYFGSDRTSWGTDTAIPAERVFFSMGPYNGEANGYGYSDVANFFAPTGAKDTGAKQALANTFRMMFNPANDPRNPPHVVLANCSPNAGGRSGKLPKITVHFSAPVSGVQASDLSLNPSTAAFPEPWVATSVVPLGTEPTADWQFDGIWTGPTGLTVPLETDINVVFNPMDPGSTTRSHVVDPATSLGVKPAQWSFLLVWEPQPAAVSAKTWTLYE